MTESQQEPAARYAVEQVVPKGAHFREVVALWRLNRKTLGLFPEGAFEACAADGNLLGVVLTDGKLVGYLAYRVHRRLNRAAIAHLCVEVEWRGRGVSDALFRALRDFGEQRGLDSIILRCRRDFRVDSMWKRLGFVARSETPGRGEDGATLTLWVFDYNRPTLFTQTSSGEEDSRLKAVLDANVFFDLHPGGELRNEEALPLLEPWVEHEVELCVVDEMHNEIDLNPTKERRRHLHTVCYRFTELRCSDHEWRNHLASVEKILGPAKGKERERADRRQLAKTAAAHAQVFLTRDTELLDAAAELEAILGVRVMRPAHLLSSLDETERALAYQPVRLAGTDLRTSRLCADEVDACVDAFQGVAVGESRAQFMAKVRDLVARVRSAPACDPTIVRGADGYPLALVAAHDDQDGIAHSVPLLRLARSPLAPTLARHLLLAQVQASAHSSRPVLHIHDEWLPPLVTEALRELEFQPSAEGWWRTSLKHVGTSASICERLAALKTAIPAAVIQQWHEAAVNSPAHTLEARFWPAKIPESEIPTFVVPIRPYWASQLFDEQLAGHDLFGAIARLALNRENVYYRSPKPCGISAPARILWYVSKNEAYKGTMAIRACSRLLSTETGPVKEIYRKYRRLGIYTWREAFETADNDIANEIMALRFADTELLSSPVMLEFIRTIGIRSQFQSPVRIKDHQFFAIYRQGFGLSAP